MKEPTKFWARASTILLLIRDGRPTLEQIACERGVDNFVAWVDIERLKRLGMLNHVYLGWGLTKKGRDAIKHLRLGKEHQFGSRTIMTVVPKEEPTREGANDGKA